jgi:N-acetylmuramoyl-L-alanine amidase
MTDWYRRAQRVLLTGSAFLAGAFGTERTAPPRRVYGFEPLEPRLPLSAAGLVPVGTQPEGGLADKIVYLHAGHGYTADTAAGASGDWSFQRSEVSGTEMIEDLGNYDQATFLADYLFRAGATIVPLRPIGHQNNEVVLDNDDPGVSFVGSGWSDSSATVYYGSAGDVPYRFASTSATETNYARYTPNIPAAGFYPVYAWTRSGSDRATDQLYRVNHSGGITEVTINHRRVGSGLVYLGTYHFESGTGGYVDISNRSNSAGSVVIADMIRFGNGMGDIDRGAGVSTLSREDESGLYWVEWHVDRSQGIPESEFRATTIDRDAAVSFSPRYAEYMNREADGALKDRVFVSYHSNAAGGRGVLGLYNGNNDPATATPNQFLLANSLGAEVNNDMVAQNALWDPDWFDRGSGVTLDRSDIEFGEINNLRINNEFDATIVEVAFHDNIPDSELMRQIIVRDAVARATYQGLIKYFRAVDGNTTSAVELPPPVTNVHAVSNAPGSVTISWTPPVASAQAGGAPTGYRIYASINGFGFDGGTLAAGGATNTATLTGYDPTLPYYFKVVAVNVGGESHESEVLTVLPSGGAKQVLVVNGFDRVERSLNFRQTLPPPNNTVDRVWPWYSNSRDYVAQVGAAIHAAKPGVHVASASNEAVISGSVDLTDYHTVVWILGEESTADETFNTTEQTKVEQFIAGGGNLFLSGAEIAWDLDRPSGPTAADRAFFENTLKGNYVSDDSNTYAVSATGGGIFAGLSNFAFDNGTLFYDSEWPDVINPQSGGVSALSYVGGSGGNAAIQHAGTGGRGDVVMFGFPFETITTAANRAAVIERVFDFFGLEASVPDNADFNDDGFVDAADYVVWRKTSGMSVAPGTLGDANHDGQVNNDDFVIWKSQFHTTPPAPGGGASAGGGAVVASAIETASVSASSPVPTAVEALSDTNLRPAREAAFSVLPSSIKAARGARRLAELRERIADANPDDTFAVLATLSLGEQHDDSEQTCATKKRRRSSANDLSTFDGRLQFGLQREIIRSQFRRE